MPSNALKSILVCIILVSILWLPGNAATWQKNDRAASFPPCEKPGWFPSDFGLKDHSIFWYQGYYYLASIYVPPNDPSPLSQDRLAYARSVDMCEWQDLSPILATRTPGTWDEKAVWAPFVYQEDNIYHLYYTGVTEEGTQSILLATSTDPSNPASWQTHPMVFQPNHSDMVWTAGHWADCRDPTVVKIDGSYHLYYSGTDESGHIIGVAIAGSPVGPWIDQGSIVPPDTSGVMESPTIAQYEGSFYLFYTIAYDGGYFRIGSNPTGPWQSPMPFRPGWAHEVWQNKDGDWMASYLTNLTVTIAPLTWDSFFSPKRPAIGSVVFHELLPFVVKLLW